jgi:hypothetical protein
VPFSYVISVADVGACAFANLAILDPLPSAFAWSGPGASSLSFAPPFTPAAHALTEVAQPHGALAASSILPTGHTITVSLPGRATALGRQSDAATVTAAGLPALRTNTVTLDVTSTPRAGGPRVNASGATGTASAAAGGPEKALSRLAHVDVAVRVLSAGTRAPAHLCQWVNGQGRLVRRKAGTSGQCDSPLWLRATGTSRWRYHFRRRLASGRYQLLIRVVNRAGVYDTKFAASHHDLVTFRV